MDSDPNFVEDLTGEHYHVTLQRLHALAEHRAYLEIGVCTGDTLALARAPSIGVDPAFRLDTDVVGNKPACHLFQMTSDDFFAHYDPRALLGRPVEFAFLDGMHHCEVLLRDFFNTEAVTSPGGIIALHDCVPLDLPMTDRVQDGTPPARPSRLGWWTGDVWRAALVIKRHRPDLHFLALDCSLTGLVVVTGLDPASTYLKTNYHGLVEEMRTIDLEAFTIRALHRELGLIPFDRVIDTGLQAALRPAAAA